MKITDTDTRIIQLTRKWFIPLARLALFIIFFWFGVLKLFGLSPAGPLAEALAVKTIGLNNFDIAFKLLAFIECCIGVLFLVPRATRIVIPLLLLHLVVVCSPLLLVPEVTWQKFLVPTLEGQYIIKNIMIVALAMGVAAHTQPLRTKKK